MYNLHFELLFEVKQLFLDYTYELHFAVHVEIYENLNFSTMYLSLILMDQRHDHDSNEYHFQYLSNLFLPHDKLYEGNSFP